MVLDGALCTIFESQLVFQCLFVDLVSVNYRHTLPEQIGESDIKIFCHDYTSVLPHVCFIILSHSLASVRTADTLHIRLIALFVYLGLFLRLQLLCFFFY